MSKTLGNGVDPIEVINQYGADALRFSVVSGTTMGNDIKYMPEKLDQSANFANKIWNAAKFITMNMAEDEEIIKFKKENYNEETHQYKENSLKIEDKWIISKLNKVIEDITSNIEKYELGVALDNIYSFIWNEFCDWYIEIVKTRLYSENKEEKIRVSYVLDYVFRTSLKLLHPFMPFVTSEIYSKLVQYDNIDLMMSSWPEHNKMNNFEQEENIIENFKKIIVGIRNTRSHYNVQNSKKTELIFVTTKYNKEIEESKEFLKKLGYAETIKIQESKDGIGQEAISIIADGMEVYIELNELVDLEEEKQRKAEEKKKIEAEIERASKMLANPGFVNKAPAAKIEEERAKLEKYKEMLKSF